MVQINDVFKYLDEIGRRRILKIVNISFYREPDMKYAAFLYDEDGREIGDDVVFFGDSFLHKCHKVNYTVN